MKKRLVKILWGMAVAALLLGGCGKKNEEQTNDTLVGTEAAETLEDEELSEQEQQDIAALKEQYEADREYNFAGINESQLNVGDNAEDETDAEDTDAKDTDADAKEETASGKEKEPAKTDTVKKDTTKTESGKKDNTSTASTTKPSGGSTDSGNANSGSGNSNTNASSGSGTGNTNPPSGNAGGGNTASSSGGSSSSGSTAHTHSYQTVSVAATCTTAGYTEEKCSCGDVRNHKDIPADGHYYEECWFIYPTCNSSGWHWYRCSKCGENDPNRGGSEAEPLPHTVAERVVYEGDCRTNKTIEQYCTVCGTVTGTREEPGAEVHDWVTGTVEELDDDLNLITYEITRCCRCGKIKE